MAAKKGNRKEAPSDRTPRAPKDEDLQVNETEQVVAAAKDDGTRQAREKAKGRKQNGFITFVKKADPIAMACFIAIILASCVVIGAYINDEYFSSGGSAVAQKGSTVEVEYVGSYFTYYNESGSVIFDTNIENVAKNDSNTFSSSFAEKSSYTNLSFKVGGTDVVKKFGDACVGHSAGDVVKVAVPASDAYGEAERQSNPDKVITLHKSGSVSLSDFNAICGTTYDSSSFPVTVSPITGMNFNAVYHSDTGMIGYTFISVDDTAHTILVSGVGVSIDFTGADTFTMTLDVSKNCVFKAFKENSSGVLAPVFIEYKAGDAGFTYWVNDLSANAEQKGETLYFYITIKSVKN